MTGPEFLKEVHLPYMHMGQMMGGKCYGSFIEKAVEAQ